MASYLLSWNPSRFDWTEITTAIATLRKNGSIKERWSCGSRTSLPRGSEIFLIRLGVAPKGIVAHGIAAQDAHQDKHWDAVRARRGDLANYVDVRFDRLAREPLVGWAELQKGELAEFRWSIQGSGVELPEHIAQVLRRKIGVDDSTSRDSGGSGDAGLGILAWRSDPTAAEAVFGRTLAGQSRQTRRLVLEFLAASIRRAHELESSRWAISLFDDLVRFNVGMVESVVIAEDGLSVLVDRDPGMPGAEVVGRGYARAGGSRLARVSYRDLADVLPRLRDHHEAAMRMAARSPCQPNVQAAHSPGVLQHLERELSVDLPIPDHWTRERASDAAESALRESRDIPETEKDALIKARIGQGRFRDGVSKVEKSCRVTGIHDPAHLRASHIKPWCESDNRERVDPCNGLMLAPHVDHLFDEGFISFSDAGDLMLSPLLSRDVLGAWRLPVKLNVGPFRAEQRVYLSYHRRKVFKKT